ncbi:MAG: PEP-CTERM sorting domain-containing protein, partial [Tepidisphaeraceae bacterium]
MSRRYVFVAAAALGCAQSARAALFAQYLTSSYTQGTIYNSDGSINATDMTFNNPSVVGDPTTSPTAGITDIDYGFPEIISPFDPPADADQIVTIGYGGQITLQFPHPITVQSSSPTLGVFTASGLADTQYPLGIAADPAQDFDTDTAVVKVSQNGTTWATLGLQTLNIPENYFTNADNPYQFPAPTPPDIADFGHPFTGTLDSFSNEDFPQILTTLNGSAGGTWLNLSAAGLTQINYIQFSEPTGVVPTTSFLALQAVSAGNASVPEPAAGAGLFALGAFLFKRRRKNILPALIIFCLSLLTFAPPTKAQPVPAIHFNDGNVLNIQGTYGSGSDTAYLIVDFPTPSTDYAWQFNWNPATSENAWQMMETIAGQSILSTSGAPGSTDVTNPTGDLNLTLTATYYPSFSEHLITNLQYGSITGTNDWDFYTTTYNFAAVTPSDPQGTNWKSSSVGIDDISLTEGEFIGWVDIFPP